MPHDHRGRCLGIPISRERAHTALCSTDVLTRVFKFALSVCSWWNITVRWRSLFGTTRETWRVRSEGFVQRCEGLLMTSLMAHGRHRLISGARVA